MAWSRKDQFGKLLDVRFGTRRVGALGPEGGVQNPIKSNKETEDRMTHQKGTLLRRTISKYSYAVLIWLLLSSIANVQATGSQPDALTEATAQVASGNWSQIGLIISTAGPVRSIPILEQLFVDSADAETKERIASSLYRLGVKDSVYWEFMAKEAIAAVDSDEPFPHAYNPQGIMQDQLSPEFINWTKAHHMSTDLALKAEGDGYTRLLLLTMTGDQRAISVLRRGLNSPDHLIQSIAAKGLAQFQDKESIPLIIASCQKAPADAAILIAASLVFFDDPQAQSAADIYLSQEKVAGLRDYVRVHGSKPFVMTAVPTIIP